MNPEIRNALRKYTEALTESLLLAASKSVNHDYYATETERAVASAKAEALGDAAAAIRNTMRLLDAVTISVPGRSKDWDGRQSKEVVKNELLQIVATDNEHSFDVVHNSAKIGELNRYGGGKLDFIPEPGHHWHEPQFRDKDIVKAFKEGPFEVFFRSGQ